MALAAAGDFLSFFVALETMSLGVYCMIGLRRGNLRASEASLKYFLLELRGGAHLVRRRASVRRDGHTDFQASARALPPSARPPAP